MKTFTQLQAELLQADATERPADAARIRQEMKQFAARTFDEAAGVARASARSAKLAAIDASRNKLAEYRNGPRDVNYALRLHIAENVLRDALRGMPEARQEGDPR